MILCARVDSGGEGEGGWGCCVSRGLFSGTGVRRAMLSASASGGASVLFSPREECYFPVRASWQRANRCDGEGIIPPSCGCYSERGREGGGEEGGSLDGVFHPGIFMQMDAI